MSEKVKLVKKEDTFLEIMRKNPKAAQVLAKEGMHCIGCSMSVYETLEQGAALHGLDADSLVKKINSSLRGKKKISKKAPKKFAKK